jgi:hypothetical protein
MYLVKKIKIIGFRRKDMQSKYKTYITAKVVHLSFSWFLTLASKINRTTVEGEETQSWSIIASP